MNNQEEEVISIDDDLPLNNRRVQTPKSNISINNIHNDIEEVAPRKQVEVTGYTLNSKIIHLIL